MKGTILGIRSLDFTDQTGRKITGKNLFLSYDDDRIDGKGTDKIFLTSDRLQSLERDPMVGDIIFVGYNRYGKIDEVELL